MKDCGQPLCLYRKRGAVVAADRLLQAGMWDVCGGERAARWGARDMSDGGSGAVAGEAQPGQRVERVAFAWVDVRQAVAYAADAYARCGASRLEPSLAASGSSRPGSIIVGLLVAALPGTSLPIALPFEAASVSASENLTCVEHYPGSSNLIFNPLEIVILHALVTKKRSTSPRASRNSSPKVASSPEGASSQDTGGEVTSNRHKRQRSEAQ
ncbi:hypothetical protein DFH27DRAFT_651426 [Peziza echinospora]|nr:hypothetical protein DFH27DRAFT_651426 [Peziza echinospora]